VSSWGWKDSEAEEVEGGDAMNVAGDGKLIAPRKVKRVRPLVFSGPAYRP
jgi:hypothetical protein